MGQVARKFLATKRKSALFVVPRQFIYAIESVRICVLLPGGFLLR